MGKKESKLEFFFRVVAPKVTSVGAAVVVVGALFKIMHWPGAGMMLTVGLLTESFLFLMGVVQPAPPPEAHYHWERVYPILDEGIPEDKVPHLKHDEILTRHKAKLKDGDGSGGGTIIPPVIAPPPEHDPKTSKKLLELDKELAKLDKASIANFGNGIKSLNQTASQMKSMGNAVTASNDFTKNLQATSKSLVSLNKSYSTTAKAMSGMADLSTDAKAYHAQVQKITTNLSSLNAVYEMELKDAKGHLKAMNKFYSNLTIAMESMADASKESEAFKKEMSKLTTNITTLNRVYGNMLTAMKG